MNTIVRIYSRRVVGPMYFEFCPMSFREWQRAFSIKIKRVVFIGPARIFHIVRDLFKRRRPVSMSGWLARVGRLRRTGKG